MYDQVLREVDDASRGRSWFYTRVPAGSERVVEAVAPDIIAATIMKLFEQLKFNEMADDGQ